MSRASWRSRAVARSGRDHQLAATLQLTPDELDFVWSSPARSIRCSSHSSRSCAAPMLGAACRLPITRRSPGSMATAARHSRAVLHPNHPRCRGATGQIAPEDTHVDVCSPLTVSPPRSGSYLQGDDEPGRSDPRGGRSCRRPTRHTARRHAAALAATDRPRHRRNGSRGDRARRADRRWPAHCGRARRGRPAGDRDRRSRIARAPGALEATLEAQLRSVCSSTRSRWLPRSTSSSAARPIRMRASTCSRARWRRHRDTSC